MKLFSWLREFFARRRLAQLLREELELKCAFLLYCSSVVEPNGSFAGPYGNAQTFLRVWEQLKRINIAALAKIHAAYPHLEGRVKPIGDCDQLRLVERIYALENHI